MTRAGQLWACLLAFSGAGFASRHDGSSWLALPVVKDLQLFFFLHATSEYSCVTSRRREKQWKGEEREERKEDGGGWRKRRTRRKERKRKQMKVETWSFCHQES